MKPTETKLTGIFKNYKIVTHDDWVESDQKDLSDCILVDHFYKNDQRYYELVVMAKSDKYENHYYEVEGSGLTLEDAEKSLEKEYDDYINEVGVYAKETPDLPFPTLPYLKVTKGHHNSLFNSSKEFYELGLQNVREIILNNKVFMLKHKDYAYHPIAPEGYSKLGESAKKCCYPDVDSDGFLLQLEVPNNSMIFSKLGCVYEMTLTHEGLSIQPNDINMNILLRYSNLEELDKDTLCDLWSAQSNYMEIKKPLKKWQYHEILNHIV